MAAMTPPNRTVLEILSMDRHGSLTSEQKWNLRFRFMRNYAPREGYPQPRKEFTAFMVSLVRIFLSACYDGDVERARDLKDFILWCYEHGHRLNVVRPILIRELDVAGYVPRSASKNDELELFQFIFDVQDCGVTIEKNVLKRLSKWVGDFYDL